MKLSDWLSLAAIIFGPLVALQISRWQERRREKRERQFRVFRTLMATRARRTSMEHVEALNMIDVEFHGKRKSEMDVTAAWREYLDQLNGSAQSRGITIEVWAEKNNDLFANLMYEMGRCLGYDFDRVHIKKHTYSPIAHGDIESDQLAIRKGVIALLKGESSIPVRSVQPAQSSQVPVPALDARINTAAPPRRLAVSARAGSALHLQLGAF